MCFTIIFVRLLFVKFMSGIHSEVKAFTCYIGDKKCTQVYPAFPRLQAWYWAIQIARNIRTTFGKCSDYCPASRTTLVATRFWVVMICPIIKCLTVLEFSFILFDLCLFITIFNFILNYVPIVTFWIFTYHKIWILLIIFCFIWSYWIIYFSTSLEVFWSVVS